MKIKVFCRVKPLSKEEQQYTNKRCVNVVNEQQISLNLNKNNNKENELRNSTCGNLFGFQKVFEDYIPQSIVFKDTCQELIDKFIQGFNTTLMAYGQTNSGKTFTVLGEYQQQELKNLKGIAPRSIDYLFLQLQNQPNNFLFSISVQFLEIYNEKILDLLNTKNEVCIREKDKNFITENLTEIFVNSQEEIYQLLHQSEQNRTTCYTGMNKNSSRSHFIFIITLIKEDRNTFEIQKSRMTIIDLAGSEKIKRTNVKGINKIEAQNINQSLTNLGKVILDLSQQKDQGFINYRDSILTKVLKNSLGGNALTNLIVTISQSKSNDSETLQTLRFGDRAQNIKNKPQVLKALNPQQMQQKINEQKEQIKQLKIKIIQLEDQINNDKIEFKQHKKQSNGQQIKQLIIQMQQEKLMKQYQIPRYQEYDFIILKKNQQEPDFETDSDQEDYKELSEYFQIKFDEQVKYQESILQSFDFKVSQLHDKLNNISLIKERLTYLKERIKLNFKKIKIEAFLDSLKSSKSSVKNDKSFLTPSKKPNKKEFMSVNFNRKLLQSSNQLPIIMEETQNSDIEELLSKTTKGEQNLQIQRELNYSQNQNFMLNSNSFSKEFDSKVLISIRVAEQLQQIHQQVGDMQNQLKNLKGQNQLINNSQVLMDSIKEQQDSISQLIIQSSINEYDISKNKLIFKYMKQKDKQNFEEQINFLKNQIQIQNKLIDYQEEKIKQNKQCCIDKNKYMKDYENRLKQQKNIYEKKIIDSDNQINKYMEEIKQLKQTQGKQIKDLQQKNLDLKQQFENKQNNKAYENLEYQRSLKIQDYHIMIKKYQNFIQEQESNYKQLYQKLLNKEQFIRSYLGNLLDKKQIKYIDQIFEKDTLDQTQSQNYNSFNFNNYIEMNLQKDIVNEQEYDSQQINCQKSISGSNIKKYLRTPLQNSILNSKKNQLILFYNISQNNNIMKKSDVVSQKVLEIKNFFVKMRIIKDNFKNTMIFLIILVCYFFIIGICMLYVGLDLFEFEHRIDDRCVKNKCQIQFKLHKDVESPIYLYIGYKDFYVNHRKVMLSVDYEQLDGSVLNKSQSNNNCKDYNLNKDGMRFYPDKFQNFPEDNVMHPCGLFPLLYMIFLSKKIMKIILKYKAIYQQVQRTQQILKQILISLKIHQHYHNNGQMQKMVNQKERFQSFLKTPTFNDFEYLQGIIYQDLKKGHYTMNINYWDNILLRDIHTFVNMKTLSGFGGKFQNLAISNIFVGIFLGICGLFLSYFHRIKFKDAIGDNKQFQNLNQLSSLYFNNQQMNSELNEQEQSKEVIAYVKNCIIKHKTEIFDISKIPSKLNHQTAKGILDPIYKTVKYKTSSKEQKNIALKILKNIILKTKNTSIINLFLVCEMWNFFCKQFRSYKRNENQSPNLIYSESYFELLEDMLQSFAQQLGRDNNDQETPFSMYWKAVHNEKKNEYMTKFILHISQLCPEKTESLQYIKDHFFNFEQREECKYFIRQFFLKYKKKSKIIDSFLKNNNPNINDCQKFKNDFYKFCEREYFYGHIENDVYDNYQKIIQLEKTKNELTEFQQIPQHENLISQQSIPKVTSIINQSHYVEDSQQEVKNTNKQNSLLNSLKQQSILQDSIQYNQDINTINQNQKKDYIVKVNQPNLSQQYNSYLRNSKISNEINNNFKQQKQESSKLNLYINSQQNNFSQMKKNTNFYIKKSHDKSIDINNNSKYQQQNDSYLKNKYDINLEREVSQIYDNSRQIDLQSENHSYRQVLNLLSVGLEINPKRLQLQRNLSSDDQKRMKSFSFIEKARLFQNSHIKVGVKIIQRYGKSKYEKLIIVQCFWETMFENIKNIQANIKHNTERYFVIKKPNMIEFQCKNFFQNLDFPKLNLAYSSNKQVNHIDMNILIPINKFMFIPKQSLIDLNKFQKKGYKVLISDQYPLDVNFFKRIKELKYIFRNFQEINDNTLAGIFNLQYLINMIYMEIQVQENFTFTVQLRYFPNGIEKFLQNFLQEIVLLLSEYGNTNYQINLLIFNYKISIKLLIKKFYIICFNFCLQLDDKKNQKNVQFNFILQEQKVFQKRDKENQQNGLLPNTYNEKPYHPIGMRSEDFLETNILLKEEQDLKEFKNLQDLKIGCRQGISSKLRPQIWRKLFKYDLLNNKCNILQQKRKTYKQYTEINDPSQYEDTNDIQYSDLLRLIKKDVNRTLPESYFFRNTQVQKSMIRVIQKDIQLIVILKE